MVLQLPQAGQRPLHLLDSCPQSLHTNIEAIIHSFGSPFSATADTGKAFFLKHHYSQGEVFLSLGLIASEKTNFFPPSGCLCTWKNFPIPVNAYLTREVESSSAVLPKKLFAFRDISIIIDGRGDLKDETKYNCFWHTNLFLVPESERLHQIKGI